jgi:ATP-binding cassette subfamily F protein uup
MDFLEKRQERIDNYNAETDKVRNVLRRELEWMRSTPQARTGKAKYRKEAFEKLRERSGAVRIEQSVDMSVLQQDSTYLGNKVVDCRHLSFSWEGKCYIKDFTYNFQRYDRVGIVGRNASGKSTFLNLIAGEWTSGMGGEKGGEIETGSSVKTGYYRQEGIDFKEDRTVLETVGDTRLLNRFLFPHEMFDNRISTLSGGEKRRLYLITVLMQQPNLLILDEPTNDLDIVTLGILEEYLLEFKGSLVIVSHDRHFLDRLVDHLFIFTGDGEIKNFVGDYSTWREYVRAAEGKDKEASKQPAKDAPARKQREKKDKLSWKEQRELESLETAIDALEKEKASLEAILSGGGGGDAVTEASRRYGELQNELDEKELRWLELSEKL